MKQRVAKQGAFAGRGFWGCTKYPECKGTRKLEQAPDAPKKVDEVAVQKITNGPSLKDFANNRKRNSW